MYKEYQQKVCKKLKYIDDCLSNKEKKQYKNQFIEKFIYCEIAYKTLLQEYNRHKNIKMADKDLKIHMGTLPKVLKFAGIEVDNSLSILLKKLFETRTKRNHKSARELRNGIVHANSVPDINEVFSRYDNLDNIMNEFLAIMHFNATK